MDFIFKVENSEKLFDYFFEDIEDYYYVFDDDAIMINKDIFLKIIINRYFGCFNIEYFKRLNLKIFKKNKYNETINIITFLNMIKKYYLDGLDFVNFMIECKS